MPVTIMITLETYTRAASHQKAGLAAAPECMMTAVMRPASVIPSNIRPEPTNAGKT
jgi:hypothetical protein